MDRGLLAGQKVLIRLFSNLFSYLLCFRSFIPQRYLSIRELSYEGPTEDGESASRVP